MIFKLPKRLILAHLFTLLTLIVNLCVVSLIINFFGSNTYGYWAVILSVTSLVQLFNLGIPDALFNSLCMPENNIKARVLINWAFKFLMWMSISFLIFGSLFSLFNFKNQLIFTAIPNEIYTTGVIYLFFILLSFPFIISRNIFRSQDLLHWSKFYDFCSSLLSLVSILLIYLFEGGIFFYAFLLGGSFLLLNIISFIHSLRAISVNNPLVGLDIEPLKTLVKPGLKLFATGLGAMLIWNTDNLIIASVLGSDDVASYSIAFKLFAVGNIFLSLFTAYFMPRYATYFNTGDWKSFSKLINKLLLSLSFLAFVFSCFIILFTRDIISLWLGSDELYINDEIMSVLGVYGLVLVNIGVLMSVLTVLNRLKNLVLLTIIEAVFNIVLSLLFIRSLGLIGVPLATLCAAILVPGITLPFKIRKDNKLLISIEYQKMLKILLLYFFCIVSLLYFNISELSLFIKAISLISITLLFSLLLKYLFKINILNKNTLI